MAFVGARFEVVLEGNILDVAHYDQFGDYAWDATYERHPDGQDTSETGAEDDEQVTVDDTANATPTADRSTEELRDSLHGWWTFTEGSDQYPDRELGAESVIEFLRLND